MKVLIISRGCPNEQDPIYGNFEYEQALTLSAIGVDIIFSFIDRRSRTSYQRKRGLIKHEGHPFPVYGGYCYPVIPFKYFPRLSSWLYSKRFAKLFKIIVEKEGIPDLIHCHYLFNLPMAVAVSQKHGIPIVETEHWSDLKKRKLPFYINYMSRYYKFAHSVVSVSESLKNTLTHFFSVESHVIYNMVADDYLDYFAPSNSFKKTIRLISVGSLIHRKGYDLLIEALSGINCDNWELQIIGEGSVDEEIKKKIHEKGLVDQIHLLGKQNKAKIRELMHNSDVFVLASRSETFGVVYIEAMACGLPVIATKCGGPEEFITPELGRLIEIDDVEGLRDSLKWMLTHYQNYDKELIHKRCSDLFSSKKIASEYLSIYKETMEKYENNIIS